MLLKGEINLSKRVDVFLASTSRHTLNVCACMVSKAGTVESVGQCAVDKIAATCLAPVCYSYHTIVVKILLTPPIPDLAALRFYCPYDDWQSQALRLSLSFSALMRLVSTNQ